MFVTPQVVAVQQGKLNIAEALVSLRAKIDIRLSNGYALIHCAVHRGNLQIVGFLLKSSKDSKKLVNEVTPEGITPLMLAKSVALIDLLIKAGADPKLKAKNGKTALDFAVKRDDLDACKWLLPLSTYSASTIEYAIKKGSIEINQLLAIQTHYIHYRNSVDDHPLIMALRFANLPLVEHLLNKIKDPNIINAPNKLGETPLEIAALGGFYPIVAALIKKGGIIDQKKLFSLLLKSGYTKHHSQIKPLLHQKKWDQPDIQDLLLIAAKAGNYLAISNLLIPMGADLNQLKTSQDWKIEHFLATCDGIFLFRKCFLNAKDLLLKLPKEGNKTVAFLAGENRSLRVLEFLLDLYIEKNISFENHFLDRHLFYSVLKSGELDGVALFLEKIKDAKDQILDSSCLRPVHLAAQLPSNAILKYLHAQGAELSIQDTKKCDPLFYAIQAKSHENIAFLLNETQNLPITLRSILAAAATDDKKVLINLLKAGANINCIDEQGDTSLMLAIEKGDLKACLRTY